MLPFYRIKLLIYILLNDTNGDLGTNVASFDATLVCDKPSFNHTFKGKHAQLLITLCLQFYSVFR
jgi:hypothetical protein